MWATTSSASSAKRGSSLRALILLLLVCVPTAHATPAKVEVWFLTEAAAKTTSIPELLRPLERRTTASARLANNDYDADCIPMGEGCFHPQTGMVLKSGAQASPEDAPSKGGDGEWKGKVFSSDEVSMVECKKDYYFDVFCGKEKKEAAVRTGFEVWIDNSSSIRGIDYGTGDQCFRRTFAEKLRNACPGKVEFSVYNNSKKSVSDLSVICTNSGGNDPDRLMRWIRDSEARELIVITDVAEHTEKFEIFLDSIGGVMRGMGVKPFKAQDLDSLLKEATKYCP